MKYFYVIFTIAGVGRGNTVLKQEDSPDGFNIAGAHTFLMDKLKTIVIIESFTEITERRYTDFKLFTDKIVAQYTNQKPSLSVVDGGGENPQKPGSGLVIVPTDKK